MIGIRLMLAIGLIALPLDAALSQSVIVPADRPSDQWLLIIRFADASLHDPANWTPASLRGRQVHYDYLQRLAAQGSLIFGGRTYDSDSGGRMASDTIGVIILRAPSRAAAEELVTGDPSIRDGLFAYELHSYRILVAERPAR